MIISDKTWKISPDLAWDNQAPVIGRFQMVVNDRMDLRKALNNWQMLNFEDSNWDNATPLMRNVGWPAPQKNATPQPLTPPWTTLVPREVPYLIEKEENDAKLILAKPLETDYLAPYKTVKHQVQSGILMKGTIEAGIQKKWDLFQGGKATFEVPSTKDAKPYGLIIDFGSLQNSYAQLKIEGAAGTKIDILYTPHLMDNRFCHNVLDSDFRDQIILSGQKDSWTPTYWKPTRYMAVIIYDLTKSIKIHHIGRRTIHYPFEQSGQIYSSDAEWVKRYMEATAKTIQICTTDAYTDNYRERRQYAQTGYYGALGNYWIFGDHALQRRYLVQVAQEQDANGIMPAYAPLGKDDYMVILDSNCLWIRSFWTYFLYSEDTKTVKELLPAASKLMDLMHGFTNDLGMMYNPPYPYWLDHSKNDRRGANLNLNGHYLGALEDFAKVLNAIGDKRTGIFNKRTNLLRQSLQKYLWDDKKQLFADAYIEGERSIQFSEHANAMALSLKIATPKQAKAIATKLLESDELNYINRASRMTMVTPAMSYFLHKGLCEYGYISESFELTQKAI